MRQLPRVHPSRPAQFPEPPPLWPSAHPPRPRLPLWPPPLSLSPELPGLPPRLPLPPAGLPLPASEPPPPAPVVPVQTFHPCRRCPLPVPWPPLLPSGVPLRRPVFLGRSLLSFWRPQPHPPLPSWRPLRPRLSLLLPSSPSLRLPGPPPRLPLPPSGLPVPASEPPLPAPFVPVQTLHPSCRCPLPAPWLPLLPPVVPLRHPPFLGRSPLSFWRPQPQPLLPSWRPQLSLFWPRLPYPPHHFLLAASDFPAWMPPVLP
mmetsp:Transcript_91875/g.230919  ORF Transcript_91875/g.230919 Transcript_91875/m.230919 type:complete len:259 (-) Transcript_91875:256-1032(-)